jgi:hypothetical protein
MTEICTWPSCAHTAKGQCQPDKPITVPGLYAEITRLKEEVERLRAELRTAADMNAVYEGRLQEKEAEVGWLRAALKLFECDCEGEEFCYRREHCRNYIARAALTPSQEPRT